jgi:prophage antirepressor-like protein
MHSGELTTLFEGREVRVIERDGEPWFPLFDLAAAWGVDRKTPGNLVDRNKELFAGMFHSDGDVTYHDVNERGLYVLMGKISADRLKNPEAKAAMIRFQRWVPELIQKYRKKEIVQQPINQDAALKASLSTARMLATETGGDLAAFQRIALEKCGLGDWAPALSTVPKHGEPGWYNPTQLGEMCGLTAEQVNAYLYNKAFQYREGKIWRLNPSGEMHGKEYVYEATSGHREIRIRWRESILYASGLKRPIDESQLALPARA